HEINVTGNSRTRDEVVRRELRQLESSWYDGERINRSRTRVDRLGYFDEVTLETPAVPATTDQVDVNVNVKERPTGSVMIGAGFSSSEKLVLSASIQQQNLFGSGKTVGAQLNTSRVNKVYSFSYTDPYYTIDGISRGFDVYKRNTDTSSLSTVGTYGSSSIGGGVRYGLPIAEDDYISLGLSIDSTKLTVDSTSPTIYQQYVNTFGADSTTLLGTAGWLKETIDSRLYPTKGTSNRLVGEIGLPGGSLHYYRATYQHQRFIPVPLFSKKFTLMLNGEAGYANGYGGRALPFFKNYFAGGIGSVRGYDSSSLGPLDQLTGYSLGGNRRLIGNGELLFPLPGAGQDKSLRLGLFVDGGQVWGRGQKISLGDMRYSTGFSLSWSSPMGPLKFSFATPLNDKPGDRVQRLQFQMGTMF
ncbi:MAG: outer membrane protein assembly factor BamA, partial [Proteobacteria bacterium]|nr:outer membrane protein assembly factor BamA [Pseudomonadota bacterium]